MMASYRRINGYSTASLAAKLEAIADMLELDGPGAAAKLVRHVPRVLGCSLEALEERVEGLAALLTQHDMRQFVQVGRSGRCTSAFRLLHACFLLQYGLC